MKQLLIYIFCCFFLGVKSTGQSTMTLENIFTAIAKNHPIVKVYDAKIQSADQTARGARSWSAPMFGAGFFMTPYNIALTKASDTQIGMGSFMISAAQDFPNKKEQDANALLMQSMSSADKQNKQVALNELYADAKKNYYDWIILQKKITVLDEDAKLLNFMIQSAELRYKNNLGKLNAYYKAKASLTKIDNQREMLSNEVNLKKIALNTLMNRDKNANFIVDTNYTFKKYNAVDSNYFVESRSDIKALNQDLQIDQLQLNLEKTKQLPQFGVEYNHMFAFGKAPWLFTLMATVKIPLAPWSSGSYKASIESLKYKAQAYEAQKEMIINQSSGEAESLLSSISSKRKQLQLFDDNIIPALRRNFQIMQLAYEQNTGELFELFDAWETLAMTQLDYLDQLQELLSLQVQMDKILEQK